MRQPPRSSRKRIQSPHSPLPRLHLPAHPPNRPCSSRLSPPRQPSRPSVAIPFPLSRHYPSLAFLLPRFLYQRFSFPRKLYARFQRYVIDQKWFDDVARRPLWAGEDMKHACLMMDERGGETRRDERDERGGCRTRGRFQLAAVRESLYATSGERPGMTG